MFGPKSRKSVKVMMDNLVKAAGISQIQDNKELDYDESRGKFF